MDIGTSTADSRPPPAEEVNVSVPPVGFRRAGWKILFFPGAEVVHVGGASHGGSIYVENLRGHLRFFAKHDGAKTAERARLLLLWSLRLRALVQRREAYREGIRFLSSGSAATVIR